MERLHPRKMISIHALLAESDYPSGGCRPHAAYFYPRSPCGERQPVFGGTWIWKSFLSTLSLRRATAGPAYRPAACRISIHALLAESDTGRAHRGGTGWNFYPRSPCGERPHANGSKYYTSIFLSTLSLRRATRHSSAANSSLRHFYPRSPCGERPTVSHITRLRPLFLSTLSLRRATQPFEYGDPFSKNFYPRSPCGERPLMRGHS